jgi:hypothetical protein
MSWSQIAAKNAGNSNNFQQAPTTVISSQSQQNQQQQQQSNVNQPFQAQRIRANDAQFRLFMRGVDAVLSQWTALQLVCNRKSNNPIKNNNNANNGTATVFNQGPANQMREDLREWFADDGEIFSDEMEDYFYDFFERERAACIEDGSLKEVADSIHEMYRVICANNDETLVLRYEHSLMAFQEANTLGLCVNFGASQGNENDDDEDEDDPDAALRGYDEEGNYVGGDDDAEYDEENDGDYDDNEDGSGCYVDEDGAPALDDRAISKAKRKN